MERLLYLFCYGLILEKIVNITYRITLYSKKEIYVIILLEWYSRLINEPPPKIHVLIPENYKYVFYMVKKDFADVI